MNPEQRRKRASELAAELNADPFLVTDVRFLITTHTAKLLTSADALIGSNSKIPQAQFVGRENSY